MTDPTVLVDDNLWNLIAPLLPPQPPRPQGGRPRLSDRVALNGILFVLETGIPWERLPQHLGFGSGMTCWRRLRFWQQTGVWPALQEVLTGSLDGTSHIDWSRAYAELTLQPDTDNGPAAHRRPRRLRRE